MRKAALGQVYFKHFPIADLKRVVDVTKSNYGLKPFCEEETLAYNFPLLKYLSIPKNNLFLSVFQ